MSYQIIGNTIVLTEMCCLILNKLYPLKYSQFNGVFCVRTFLFSLGEGISVVDKCSSFNVVDYFQSGSREVPCPRIVFYSGERMELAYHVA